MKIHLRFTSNNPQHTHLTLFIDGKNNGALVMSNEEAIWFQHVLDAGCTALSPAGTRPIEFVSSGKPPACEDTSRLDAVVRE